MHLINFKASYFTLFLLCFFFSCGKSETIETYDVIVIGEGTGATSAAIQSARSGAKTLWVNPLEWAGGMLTSAGVSATDGNHKLPAGLWGEFRQLIRDHYGGADSIYTGWVSNTMFEPKVGAMYWQQLIDAEENLTYLKRMRVLDLHKGEEDGYWRTSIKEIQGNGTHVEEHISYTPVLKFRGKILVEGTDLGDWLKIVDATFDIGMDSKNKTNESIAPDKKNNIVQDVTYAAILKDYGKNANKTIPKPKNYDASQFYCACKTSNCDNEKAHPCDKMLSYGKLPNGKYMINWPKHGNDYYADLTVSTPYISNKEMTSRAAKNKTLQFVYFIQTELGYSNLGLAEDEFPTDDNLPLYPYHREGRRVHGEVQLNINHILKPYDYNLYRTGIAVGDYPIDHHHAENPYAPEIDFPYVPSFSIPVGCLVPKNVDHLLVADKTISVTNIVNGASRLQPVIIQVGQAAGLMAAMAAQQNISPKELNIRQVQQRILKYQGYLLPFIDVPSDDSNFAEIQRIGATGILRGKGIPFKWANQTWFYPDTLVDVNELLEGLKAFDKTLHIELSNEPLTIEKTIILIDQLCQYYAITEYSFSFLEKMIAEDWETHLGLKNFDWTRPITKRELAVLLDTIIDPFTLGKIEIDGLLKISDL